ncbi:hypothetical protein Psi01_06220 [Planobispora siamensis]|uniref:Trypsin-like peptidase domain-containing protein n=2 Tax=Planobispora siamensis TaxID=936338 RepID=A0A8J3S8Q5_9ACTN|nr:hypothetical protein Psi01_06220 [Planobispora siamensis]
MAVVAALAVAGTLGSLGAAVAETDPAPAATRIAAQANPAVQLIETTYSGRITVPSAAPKKAFTALHKQAQEQARKGRIPSDQLSIAKWAFRKVAADPGKYIGAAKPQRTDDVTFAGTCTGWWITPDGHMITAGHCVQSAPADVRAGFATYGLADVTEEDVKAELKALMGAVEPDKELTELVTKVYETFNTRNLEVTDVKVGYNVVLPLPGGGMNATSTRLPIELVAAEGTGGPGKDVALLKLADARNLPTVPLGSDGDVRVGNTLYAVGFPGTINRDTGLTEKSRLYPAITEGVYSARRETTQNVPYIQAQTPIYGGNSGGPVFNAEGKVIALVSATYLNESGTDRQENQSVFFPVGQINDFLTAQGVTPQESQTTRIYNTALNDFFADRHSAALAGFKEALRLYPLHPYAAGYIAEAEEAIAAGRDTAPAATPSPTAGTASPSASASAVPDASASATGDPAVAAGTESSAPAAEPSIEAAPVSTEKSLLKNPMTLGIFGAALLALFLSSGLLMARNRRFRRRQAALAAPFPTPAQFGPAAQAPGAPGVPAVPYPGTPSAPYLNSPSGTPQPPSPYGTPVPPPNNYGTPVPPPAGWNPQPPGRN